jgi:hypothetical protein
LETYVVDILRQPQKAHLCAYPRSFLLGEKGRNPAIMQSAPAAC